ncbi:MAG: hypothetical protein QM500_15950 [Methylococcales bacterium]
MMSMKIYKPTRMRRFQMVALILRSLGKLLTLWPWLLLAGLILSPVSPHMLVTYTYEKHGTHRIMMGCNYIGIRGWTSYSNYGECPYFAMIDRRDK